MNDDRSRPRCPTLSHSSADVARDGDTRIRGVSAAVVMLGPVPIVTWRHGSDAPPTSAGMVVAAISRTVQPTSYLDASEHSAATSHRPRTRSPTVNKNRSTKLHLKRNTIRNLYRRQL